jgi:hypothetical protein
MNCANANNRGRLQMSLHGLQRRNSIFNLLIHKTMQIENTRTYQSYQFCTSTKIHKMSGLKHIQKLLNTKPIVRRCKLKTN